MSQVKHFLKVCFLPAVVYATVGGLCILAILYIICGGYMR